MEPTLEERAEMAMGIEQDGYEVEEEQEDFSAFLPFLQTAYRESTSFLEQGIFHEWETNLNHFNSRHAEGSRYVKSEYQKRITVFRPKTRANIRDHEATAASALFTNEDLTYCQPVDPGNNIAAAAARLNQALLQYRLSRTIPWYQQVLGAYQDTLVYGICISRQGWTKKEVEEIVPSRDEDGNQIYDDDGVMLGAAQRRIVKDEPYINGVKPEHFRYDPNCDWRDPANTSPYLIEIIPMYVEDVQAMMCKEGETPKPGQWRYFSEGEIISKGMIDDLYQVKNARDGKNRATPEDIIQTGPYALVWVFRFIVCLDGEDFVFYSLSDQAMLTGGAPLKEESFFGRDYVVGFSVIESHRAYPSSPTTLSAPLQREINDLANMRMENVLLALNKRYAFKRQKAGQIDLASVMRNYPGGGFFLDDPTNDMKVIDTPDITSSSYAEHDRLAVEFDEITGNFGGASVQNNRSLNETVGGMQMLGNSANRIQDYTLMTFIKTYVNPVLQQLSKLINKYESNETILAVAANQAKLLDSGYDPSMEALYEQDLVVSVNVGMGNTDPFRKLQKFKTTLDFVAQAPDLNRRIKWDEVGKEIFSAAGFGDGTRFLLPEDQVPEQQPDPLVMAKVKEIEVGLELRQKEIDNERYEIDKRYERDQTKVNVNAGIAADQTLSAREQAQLNDRTKRQIAAGQLAQKRLDALMKQRAGGKS